MAALRRAGLTAAAGLAVLASGRGSHYAAGGPGAAKARRPASATAAASPGSGTPGPTAAGAAGPLPRCHTSQLAVAFTGLSAAGGGRRDLRLILTNRSSLACHIYGYPGLGFPTVTGLPLPRAGRRHG